VNQVNRRDFLKTGVLVAASMIAGPIFPPGNAADDGVADMPQQESMPMNTQPEQNMDGFKVYAINGSPRKHRNTGTLLEKALEGAANKGARTKLIHLYDYN
jgi:hypothetical protein